MNPTPATHRLRMPPRAATIADALADDATIMLGPPARRPQWRHPHVHRMVAALLVATAYYGGGHIDDLLGWTGSPAVLWPPNAVLLSALLLVPRSYWWVYVLAVLPADRAISASLPLVSGILLYLSNTTQSLLAAALVRSVYKGMPRWNDAQYLVRFLRCAVVIAPALAALLGATAVRSFDTSRGYWAVWQGWLTANALTNLAFVPAITIAMRGIGRFLRREHQLRSPLRQWQRLKPRASRALETAALMLALMVTAICVFTVPWSSSHGGVVWLFMPAPLLLWAALRVGLNAVVAGSLLVTCIAITGVAQARGPLGTLAATDRVLQLQLVLMTIILPNLFLAVVTQSAFRQVTRNRREALVRRRAQHELRASEELLRASVAKIRDLAGRLIVAQENERMRIARELHDDFNQHLAALSIALSGMKKRLPQHAIDLSDELNRLQQDMLHLCEEVRQLSHDLHPGVLQHAGLVPALRSRIREFCEHHRIDATLEGGDADDLREIPSEVALCLYRVAQESLQNVARHASAQHVRVTVRRDKRHVELDICDDGCGFDVEAKRGAANGLGLISLDERISLLGGTLEIESLPNHGTTVHACVPV